MAILRKSVLGTFTNKVGQVVGSSWKGIPVVRSLPASVANPRSSAQMTQRMRFALMINFAVAILTGWIRPLWNRDAKKMSGFNAFVRANMHAFNLNGEVVSGQILASRGRLLKPATVTASTGPDNVTLTVVHPTNDRYQTPNDEIYVLLWDNGTQRLLFAGATGSIRGNGVNTVVAIVTTHSPNMDVWVAYRHPRGIFTSLSYYTHIGTGQGIITPTSEMLFSFATKMKIDTSNIDTSLDEAAAVAVLKEAIKEKAATKSVSIDSEGEVKVIPTPDKHPYNPEFQDIDISKDSFREDYDFGELDAQAPMSKKGNNRGNR